MEPNDPSDEDENDSEAIAWERDDIPPLNRFGGESVDIEDNHARFADGRDEKVYAKEWRLISNQVRNNAGFHCQKCDIDLNVRPHLLHVHHLDRNKHNNESYNLIAVCALCHSEYSGHIHIRFNLSPGDLEFLRSMKGKPAE